MDTTAATDGTAGFMPQADETPENSSPVQLLGAEFERFYTTVHRYLLHRLFDRELAEELTAETFYHAVRSARRGPAGHREMQMWLLRIATNLANSHYRKVRLRRLLFGRWSRTETDVVEPARGVEEDRHVRVRAVLQTLPARYQAVLTLRYYERMSFAEIAATIGCREVTVRTRLSRAVRQVRERLGLRDVPE